MEASTGIEPVYTDLQSFRFPNKINELDAEKYQDKAGTVGEPDTYDSSYLTKENTATSAKVNGARTFCETVQFPVEFGPEWAGAPAIILRYCCGVAVMRKTLSKYMPDAYKRVARTVGYSLLLTDADAWQDRTVVLTARLTPQERVAMTWAVLRSPTPEQVVAVAETVLPHGGGAPIATLSNHMDEAAFLEFVQGRQVA